MIKNVTGMRILKAWTWGIWHYWLMLLLTLAFHFPLLVPEMGMPQWGDFYSFHSPMRIMAAKSLHEGQMPFLTQGIFGGYQLFSDPQFAFFYPVNFLFALLVPDPNGEGPLDAYILTNLVVLSLSALYFVRSLGFGRAAGLVAALIISMNGFVQMHITHVNILQVMATGFLGSGLLARFAWGGGRRWGLAIGAAFAMAAGNLAGHPQTSLFLHYAMGAGTIALAVNIWKRSRDRGSVIRLFTGAAISVAAGAAIAAVQLLPTAYLISICTRMNMNRVEAMGEAIRLQHLPSMLFPGFYLPLRWQLEWPLYIPRHIQWLAPNPLEALTWFGVIAFALGLVGFLGNLRRWAAHMLFWSGMFLVGASVGEQLPFYGWLYDYVPMIKVVRVPSRVLWLFYTAWALLAAMGVRDLTAGLAARGGKRTLWVVFTMTLVGVLVVVAQYKTSWLETFIRVFVDHHDQYDEGVRANHEEFLRALLDQAIIGGFFLILIMGWLVWVIRRGGSRWAVSVAMVLLCMELFIYGFARSYIIDYPPTGEVIADPFRALKEKPKGRALVPHFVHAGGPINTAMFNGNWIANGYSVTYPDWVRAFEPRDVPPWRLGIEEKVLDIWNVSDIVLRKRMALAKLGPFTFGLDDWGWSEIGAPWVPNDDETSVSERGLMPTQLVMNLDDLQTSVIQMHILCMTGRCFGFPDGTEVARLTAVPRDDSGTTAIFPFRLGVEVADSRYKQELERGLQPAHKQTTVALTRDALWEWSDDVQMHFVSVDVPTTSPFSKLVFEATGPYSTTFGVSQVILGLENMTLDFRYANGLPGFKEVASADDRYRVIRRENSPGYAWMVPDAIRGSYKKPSNIMWRMYGGNFDSRKTVIVDKRKYLPEESATVDSTRPKDFRGTATVQWPRDEEVIVQTESNDQGWLVLSQTWDKGWRGWLDGKPIELARANGPHTAVPVPAGRHEIVLRYRPVNFVLGAVVSLLAVTACLLVPWLVRRKKLPLVGAQSRGE